MTSPDRRDASHMERIDMWMWGQDYEWAWTGDIHPNLDSSSGFFTFGAEEVLGRRGWCFIWNARLAMWQDLVPLGSVTVEFTHDGDSGSGEGPIVQFRAPDGEPGPLTLVGADMDTSGALYMESPEWQGFLLEPVSYQDHFDERSHLFEHSFTRRDLLVFDKTAVAGRGPWAVATEDEQERFVRNLVHFLQVQLDEYQEVLLEGRDVLCAVAASPNTHEKVRKQAIDADALVLECLPWLA